MAHDLVIRGGHVADGLGGHAAGERASQLAIRTGLIDTDGN